ncbi:unnamed protein product [Adineta steineri]|uniref:Uncharacterized protein n=1 Tax=Adineta steineri TaxID=433720 RepID=A0A818MJH5_9BILA|nr:unnamed protein product [Adineta steineri]
MDVRWTEFENSATYDYARRFVETNCQPQVKEETLNIEKLVAQILTSMDWIMTAMARVKMSNVPLPTFEHSTNSNT